MILAEELIEAQTTWMPDNQGGVMAVMWVTTPEGITAEFRTPPVSFVRTNEFSEAADPAMPAAWMTAKAQLIAACKTMGIYVVPDADAVRAKVAQMLNASPDMWRARDLYEELLPILGAMAPEMLLTDERVERFYQDLEEGERD